MNDRIAQELADFDPSSKVWIYTAGRVFDGEEMEKVDHLIGQFATEWVSHNKQLKAHGGLYAGRFIILVVDQSGPGASGCSIDTSVRFVKDLGRQTKTDFFNRMLFSFYKDEKLETTERSTFQQYVEKNLVNAETLMVDTLVSTKEALISTFIKPLKNSWHVRLVDGVV